MKEIPCNNSTLNKLCDDMQIPMLIVNIVSGSIIYKNTWFIKLFEHDNKQYITEYIDYKSSQNKEKWHSVINSKTHEKTVRWEKLLTDDHRIFFSVRVVENKSLLSNDNSLIATLINKIPVAIYIKDKNGIYIQSNTYHETEIGANVLGKSDYELFDKQTAHQLRQNDLEVIKAGIEQYYIETVNNNRSQNEKSLYLTIKKIQKHQQQFLLHGVSINLSKIHKNLLKHYLKSTTVSDEDIELTNREIQCLSWISQGKSTKEVAMILGVTAKTVEFHINNAKAKLGCYKASQLGYIVGKFYGIFMNRTNVEFMI